jgi:hypothetical protein
MQASTIGVNKRGHAHVEIVILPASGPMTASPGARLCPLGRPGPVEKVRYRLCQKKSCVHASKQVLLRIQSKNAGAILLTHACTLTRRP